MFPRRLGVAGYCTAQVEHVDNRVVGSRLRIRSGSWRRSQFAF